jgi:hypothetical protein
MKTCLVEVTSLSCVCVYRELPRVFYHRPLLRDELHETLEKVIYNVTNNIQEVSLTPSLREITWQMKAIDSKACASSSQAGKVRIPSRKLDFLTDRERLVRMIPAYCSTAHSFDSSMLTALMRDSDTCARTPSSTTPAT